LRIEEEGYGNIAHDNHIIRDSLHRETASLGLSFRPQDWFYIKWHIDEWLDDNGRMKAAIFPRDPTTRPAGVASGTASHNLQPSGLEAKTARRAA
jgi:hypothetical protein